jgi:dihydroorotate dehydrogenase (NAD+) catalytic subunit
MARTEIEFPTPYMNAAGTAGFAPSARWALEEEQGVFITNPLSRAPRTPAAARAALPYPGGYWLHSGLPNPGLRAVLEKYAPIWARAALPVWVHLIPATPFEAAQMVQAFEGLENVTALEIGLEYDKDPAGALEILSAAAGELPLVACVPLTAPVWWLKQLPAAGAAALTLSAPRGMLPDPAGSLVAGRLLGPALLPLMLAAVTNARRLGLDVIAGAGVWTRGGAAALLGAGALAVQVDGILWRGGSGW